MTQRQPATDYLINLNWFFIETNFILNIWFLLTSDLIFIDRSDKKYKVRLNYVINMKSTGHHCIVLSSGRGEFPVHIIQVPGIESLVNPFNGIIF